MDKVAIQVNSEIGKLNGVIVHTPGAEVENMTPENAQRALYSDILNLSVALPEYKDFLGVLKKHTTVFEVKDLLTDVLQDTEGRKYLMNRLYPKNQFKSLSEEACDILKELTPKKAASMLIEGIPMVKNNLTRFLDDERYCLHPLPNFFFTRDASFSMNEHVLISKMANAVRDREAIIMEAIFRKHPIFLASTIDPVEQFDLSGKGTIEGGDVLIAREDVIVMGTGLRTSSQGVDSIIEYLKTRPGVKHLLIQELPKTPESFIHLDMTFTFLDKDQCMIYEPLIKDSNKHLTIHITIDGDKVSRIREENNLLQSLKALGIGLEPVACGGNNDQYVMEREQWQSGANFFALEPGKLIGYERNVRTIEAMYHHGYEIISAADIVSGKANLKDHKKMVVTIKGNELSRGGGGARCMTMPVSRENIF
ncbi:MAG: arginine deiminase [Bacteroidales bacterium]|nr:arginine deiminase [Bacteroidales bacterium]